MVKVQGDMPTGSAVVGGDIIDIIKNKDNIFFIVSMWKIEKQ